MKASETSMCQLPKLKVAGSNPVSRSSYLQGILRDSFSFAPASQVAGASFIPPLVKSLPNISENLQQVLFRAFQLPAAHIIR